MSKSGQWVEVQIRTQRMDDIAEKGYAAHWKYKENKPASKDSGIEDWIRKVRELIENNDFSAIEFVNEFRQNLFSEEVFVFTPKGDLKTLQFGATALDFAFEIHTKIGEHCLGAKVNQKLVPLSYQLNNGDQIEILTSGKQKPSEDWLKFVVTSKARTKIKESLKEEKKTIAQDGKAMVERKLSHLKIPLNNETINKMLSLFNVKTPLEFYYNVAKDIIQPSQLKRLKDPEKKPEPSKRPIEIEHDNKKSTSVKVSDKDMVLIGDGMDKIDYNLAKCCNPIPGDEVFGFVTVSEGIKIHRTNCPNAVELMSQYGYRIVKAKWTSQKELAFLTGLKIVGADRVGIVNDVTKVISTQLKVNIRSITIDTDDGIFEGTMMVFVNDTEHLNTLISKLKEISDIISVSRINS